MTNTTIYNSENENFYLYDSQHGLSMLIHPELMKACKQSIKTDSYYTHKYKYLKNNGFFSTKRAKFSTKIEENTIKKSIYQVKQIIFEATDSCNLKCAYCIQGDLYEGFGTRKNKNINISSAIKLLKYILDLKLKNDEKDLIISFYGGEPLMNMDFIQQIIEFINNSIYKSKIDITYSMTTNATLLHKYITYLVENEFNILVSLDGNKNNNEHRIFRNNNKNSFDKVIENLDIIQKNYPKYFDEHIDINSVLNNKNSIKDIYEFIYNRYNKIPKISELTLRNINQSKKNSLNDLYKNKRSSELEYQNEANKLTKLTHYHLLDFWELAYFIKYYSINSFVSNIQSLFCDEEYFPTNTCLPFSKKIFLTNRSRILPCEKINHKYSLGEINENIEINITHISQQYTAYYNSLQSTCQFCHINKFCGVCMFSIQNLETKSIKCPNFHNNKKFQIKLHRIFSFLEKNPDDFVEILNNVTITS